MHEEEGIYETADPDRGSNTRGETPDCERYRRLLHHENPASRSDYSLISAQRPPRLPHLYHEPYDVPRVYLR